MKLGKRILAELKGDLARAKEKLVRAESEYEAGKKITDELLQKCYACKDSDALHGLYLEHAKSEGRLRVLENEYNYRLGQRDALQSEVKFVEAHVKAYESVYGEEELK